MPTNDGSKDTCARSTWPSAGLVGSREVGRMAYTDERGPMVVPITYMVAEGSVLFRVAPYSEVARHLPDARAAPGGRRHRLLHPHRLERGHPRQQSRPWTPTTSPLPKPDPRPWPEGQRTLLLRLTPEVVTGRRLLEA